MRRKDSRVRLAFIFALLAAVAIVMLGYYPGAYQGEQTATVRWSEAARTWKSLGPQSHIRAILENGTEIYTTSPHTPPPRPGESIVLDVRKNIIGWYSYTWQPNRAPR
jgi:hypothetical protein